jgi:hypothetical protein
MIEIKFERERETKNAVRFAEVVADGRERGVVGTLYVLKSDLQTIGNPESLSVTISGVTK